MTLWTVACQAPLSMGFSRQEYWRGLPCSPPGVLPNRGIVLTSACNSCIAGSGFQYIHYAMQLSPLSNSRTVPLPPKDSNTISSHFLFHALPSFWKPLISVDLSMLDIPYKWNHMICHLSNLASFAYQK